MAAFEWLQQVAPAKDFVLDWKDLTTGFKYMGESIILIGARGIWKPKQIKSIPISITSVQKSVYQDKILDDNTMHYSYRGENIMHSDNVGLREAMHSKIPLIYLHQIWKGKYFVAWPMFIIGDEPNKLLFTVRADSNYTLQDSNMLEEPATPYRQQYQTREVLVRLHQRSFREGVLHAYREHCAICKLKHRELLDAAHIIPDSEGGKPEIPNGLSLCKIHHAAFDQHIIGISPDYNIEVRQDILHEIDGPMLKYGIQAVNNQKLILPRSTILHPNKAYLDVRYKRFKAAG